MDTVIETIENADWIRNLAYDEYKQQSQTAIITFDLTQDQDIISILPEGGEKPEDLHMTLLYLGDVDKLDFQTVLHKLAFLSIQQAPIAGNFTGYGVFNPSENSEGKYPVVLLYDSPQLPVLHDRLRDVFKDERVPTHGFIPHVTLAYVDKPSNFQQLDQQKIFDTISLWWGEEHYTYDLKGTIVEKGGPGSGHFGHSGRPGKIGGSAPGVDYGDVPIDYYSRMWTNEATELLEESKKLFDTTVATLLEVKAVNGYTKKGFRDINSQLRGGSVKNKSQIARIDSAISKSVVTVDLFVYRSGKQSAHDLGYVSTSISKEVAASFAAQEHGQYDYSNISRIKIPAGSNALFIPNGFVQTKSEAKQFEVLLPRDSTFAEVSDGNYELVTGVVEKQLPIDDASRRNLIQIRQQIFYDDSDALAERMFTGEISLGQWEESMKQLIRGVHTSTAAIGKGGWDQMTASDWGRLGTLMREQYRYLHGFAETINANRDTISLKAIQARARLYGNASGFSAILMEAGADIASQLPWLPKDGSTSCLVGCLCYWSLHIIDKLKDGTKIVQATWKLQPAEHCQDCIERNGYVHMLHVPKDQKVPAIIGGY